MAWLAVGKMMKGFSFILRQKVKLAQAQVQQK
jgi:hypothetical protein